MFRKISPPSTPPLTLSIDGKSVTAERGETVASVMMRQADPSCRHTPVHGSSRAPFCMMGVCFDCLAIVVEDLSNWILAEGMGFRKWEAS